ncbi:MAG TPA: type II toxin-antitoxin system MqsA family antitoxin [Pyrinomonadaceae bacterium]|nr:type II toxin-antitoxin system MqsA family antitoxin [Pyrinomonadaceae bacterium]
MTCVVCKNKKMTRGTTVLPIERGKAVLLVTDIPARICANCGEPYIDEKTAKEVEVLANEELKGRVSLIKRPAHGCRRRICGVEELTHWSWQLFFPYAF